MHTVIQQYDLLKVAKMEEGVELAFTWDGVDITKKSKHVTGRFKLVDR